MRTCSSSTADAFLRFGPVRVVPGAWIAVDTLFQLFGEWCQNEGIEPPAEEAMLALFTERGYPLEALDAERMVMGLAARQVV